MPDLPRALAALKRMAYLLDEATGHFVPAVVLAESRNARGRYERLTNDYQSALTDAYETWLRFLKRELADTTDPDEIKRLIADGGAGLVKQLERVGQEHLPYAVTAIGTEEYMPSPDAWRMIAQAIESQASDIELRLVPDVVDKLQRSVDEETDLAAVGESLLPRVGYYAGNLWVVVQRLVGDFASQAQTRDDLVYPCRWVLDKNAKHCEACPEFAGEYESYEAMLQQTGQCVPGYFVGYPGRACWLNCRCHLELKINGVWVRV